MLAYDADGNVTSSQRSVTIAGTTVLASTTSTYDGMSNLLTNVDPDGIRSTGTWSGNNPLTQVTDPGGLALTTSYVYNALSDPTLVTDPAGHAYAFTYGANRTATQTTLPGRGTINGTFDSAGKLLTSADALGTTTTYTYDAAGHETRAEVRDASSTLLRRVDHAYDANGNPTSESVWRTVWRHADRRSRPSSPTTAHESARRHDRPAGQACRASSTTSTVRSPPPTSTRLAGARQ